MSGEELNQEDIDNINKDIDAAKDKLVSKDTEAQIAQAKEEAKKEAAKEFETNQRIKELEAEKLKLQDEAKQKEVESAEKLSALSDKVNTYVESKAVVNKANPFNNTVNENAVDNMSDEDIEKIESGSLNAFLADRTKQ